MVGMSLDSLLNRIGYRPVDAGAEAETFRRDVIVAFFTLSGALLITCISIWELLAGREPIHLPKYTLTIGLIITGVYVVLLKYRKSSIGVTVFFMVMLHFFWLVTGDIANSGMFWCLVTAALLIHLLGHRLGLYAVSGVWLASAALLLWPGRPWILAQYSDDLCEYFLLAYAVLAWFSCIVEYIRFRTEQRLKVMTARMAVVARTDELTGLSNRRGLREFLASPQQEARRKSASTSIMVGDLDHFKAINDQFGHDVGDLVLQRVGATLQSLLRSEDLVARWGGEEFIVVLQETDVAGASAVAEKVLEAVNALVVTVPGHTVNTSISIGLSLLPAGGSLETALKQADRALFVAKEKGRNRLEIAADARRLRTHP